MHCCLKGALQPDNTVECEGLLSWPMISPARHDCVVVEARSTCFASDWQPDWLINEYSNSQQCMKLCVGVGAGAMHLMLSYGLRFMCSVFIRVDLQ